MIWFSDRPQAIPTLPNPHVGWRTPAPVTVDVQRYEHPTKTFAVLYPTSWSVETLDANAIFTGTEPISMQIEVLDNARTHAEVVGFYTSLTFPPETQLQRWSETNNSTVLAYAIHDNHTDKINQTLVFIDTFPQYTYVQTIILDREAYERYYDLVGLLANNVEYIQGQ